MPAGFNKSRGNGIDPDLLWFQFFYQRFGKEMNGGLVTPYTRDEE